MKKVLVVSFFKSNNLGDLALSYALENIMNEKGYGVLKYDFPTVTAVKENTINTSLQKISKTQSKVRTVFRVLKQSVIKTLNPNNLENAYYFYNINTSEKWKGFIRDLKNCDILILAGGNMVMDISNTLSIPNWSSTFRTYCRLAYKYKKDIYVAYIGAGPINLQESKGIFRKALYLADEISVRDPLSKAVCEELVPEKKIIQTVDPVFSLAIQRKRNFSQTNLSTYNIGICVLAEHCFTSKNNYEEYINGLVKLVRELKKVIPKDKNVEFTLFSTETADYNSVEKLLNKLSNEDCKTKIKQINKIDELIKLYEELNFLIGGRMHSLIFAQICLLPFIGIVWQHKITGFAKVTNSEERIYEVNILIEDVNSISKQIVENINNKFLIEKMTKQNIELRKLVKKGISI